MKGNEAYTENAVRLLQDLVRLPSFSRDEWQTASHLTKYLFDHNIQVTRVGNNVLAQNKHFRKDRPTLLLNSHHDTVQPNKGYTRDPFDGAVADGKIYGLGSNDAGGALVCLLTTFLHFHEQPDLAYNLVFAASAEEEVSGTDGIESALKFLPPIACAIVGEPTGMEMAVAERGLMVLDGLATGKAGHAARNEGVNALYRAVDDINWIRNYRFEKVSDFLGPVQMQVTAIETDNKTHNIVPPECRFTVDIRVNEMYSLEEVLQVIRMHVQSEVTPRSMRLRSTHISQDHPLVRAGLALGKKPYGSPTTSDKALVSFPALKIGPGESARSHTADE
ncbi:MAG TPA: M20/M25/M40 family metallo-hydrolase, partial [Flavisolibacter sp.]